MDKIQVRGAHKNNLKNIDLDIPRHSMTVVTGPSGSGKSSLAFDTLYAEGERRYVQSFSTYARQFLDRLDRAAVSSISGIPPAIAVGQRPPGSGARSTVGTMTEITDHLKLLYARTSHPRCPECSTLTTRMSEGRIFEALPKNAQALICFPSSLTGTDPGTLQSDLLTLGFRRVLSQPGSEVRRLDHPGDLEKILADSNQESVDVVVDRVKIEPPRRGRVVDSLELAFRFGAGEAAVALPGNKVVRFSNDLRCADCDVRFPTPEPHLFSFNSPLGACRACQGFGRVIEIDPEKVIPDPGLSLSEGAIKPWTTRSFRDERRELLAFCKEEGISLTRPFQRLSKKHQTVIFRGKDSYPGIDGFFQWLEKKNYKMHIRILLARYRGYSPCPTCSGERLTKEALAFEVNGKNISAFHRQTVKEALSFLETLKKELSPEESVKNKVVVGEIESRLSYLMQVGLSYLPLDRPTRTLSGGEAERVDLTSALGSRLSHALYVLDEPSIGLHPCDNERLIAIIKRLRDAGNTVVLVEHDTDIIRHADHVVDLGVGAGERGGTVVAVGSPEEIAQNPKSLTGAYLVGGPDSSGSLCRKRITNPSDEVLSISLANLHNLKNVKVDLPLGRFVVVAGVSGSGKSSLVIDSLAPTLTALLAKRLPKAGSDATLSIEGFESLSELVVVDQKPIGTTPRGNPGTYTKALGPIRNLLAKTSLARERGYASGMFSFNVAGGRCETCSGDGVERVEMQFLADIFIPCEDCDGTRFQKEVLDVRWNDCSIADILSLTIEQALELFREEKPVLRALLPLSVVGLSYLKLGQPLNTLSGGEGQRLKLSARLRSKSHGRKTSETKPCLFVLDEPTTGLHPSDVEVLIRALDSLITEGHSVLVIEHNLQVISSADHVIELGPEGGPLGGEVVFEGSPEDLHLCERSPTGGHIKKERNRQRRSETVREKSRSLKTRSAPDKIQIKGAREHNLKNISLCLPTEKLVIITGPSGSGKSTLAFDIVFAEGQRRYIESLSAYARRYLHQGTRPDVDLLDGVPPTIAIEQRLTQGGRRSTVATVTEIFHYLRLLFARAGTQTCPKCGIEAIEGNRDQMIRLIGERFDGKEVTFFSPVIRARKGLHKSVVEKASALGFHAIRFDGIITPVNEFIPQDRHVLHDVDIVIGKTKIQKQASPKLKSLVKSALEVGKGTFFVRAGKKESIFSQSRSCPECGRAFDEPDPRDFSFNSRKGRCTDCDGLGFVAKLDPEQMISPEKSLGKGALQVLNGVIFRAKTIQKFVREIVRKTGVDAKVPWGELSQKTRDQILFGEEENPRNVAKKKTGKKSRAPRKPKLARRTTGSFEGVIPRLEEMLKTDERETLKRHLDHFKTRSLCTGCRGGRLNETSRSVHIDGLSISEVAHLPVQKASSFFAGLRFQGKRLRIAKDLVSEIRSKLEFLEKVGLGYLGLDRRADTLSGGETQRVRLAAGLGSRLTGSCYVLDEPTIGLHPRDNDRLLEALKDLCTDGNTVLVVEHDEDTILAGDHLVELGPGGGTNGGNIVLEGPPSTVLASKKSLTGQCLRQKISFPTRSPSCKGDENILKVWGATEHNLKGVDVAFPLNQLIAVTGVSGSGKTTLIRDVLYRSLRKSLGLESEKPGAHKKITGHEKIGRVVEVDQTPLGRTSRSIPASYVGFFTDIRKLFSMTQIARERGYAPGRFSFNVSGGRCEACSGQGQIRLEMNFLPDVFVQCEGCNGGRYTRETLDARFRGKSIKDVLDMTIEEAHTFFANFPAMETYLKTLIEVGLSYLTLGQPSNTLSGGEAGRIKLAAELGANHKTPTLFVLDEPTTGLHLFDVEKLIHVMRALVKKGHTVVVIEHNLPVMAQADWIIDLGPEGGEEGGTVTNVGPPADVARSKTHTGKALRSFLKTRATRTKTAPKAKTIV